MVADDEMSIVQLCRVIRDQPALVVVLADDAALQGKAMRQSQMHNERKCRMRESASGSGHDADLPAAGPDLSGERDSTPAGERKGTRE
jgi:hypothetical protein